MNKKPLLSIIVPVYNAENYLYKCVDSLIHQTLKDLEIILVNDCSTDRSQEIIDEYVKKDSRVKSVIHEKNSGAGIASNTGLDTAKGKYITFVDNDDWLDLNAYQYLCERIEKEKVDVLSFQYQLVNKNDKILYISETPSCFLQGQEIAKAYLNIQITVAVWSKIYRRELFEDKEIRFPSQRLYQDLATSFHILCKAKSFLQIPETFYHYYHRPNSMIKTIFPQTVSDYVLCFDAIKKLCIQYQIENYEQDLDVLMSHHLTWNWHLVSSQKNINSEIFAKFYQEMSTLFGQIGIDILSKFAYQLKKEHDMFENNRILSNLLKYINWYDRFLAYKNKNGLKNTFQKIVKKIRYAS